MDVYTHVLGQSGERERMRRAWWIKNGTEKVGYVILEQGPSLSASKEIKPHTKKGRHISHSHSHSHQLPKVLNSKTHPSTTANRPPTQMRNLQPKRGAAA
ncbi:hypothetical protein VTJ04DRAFT_10204 [Mycothermus thermophilus]|uniref:uncharacterized protein n=1 Tax=Humicola insolens TaxID=85995 RepID=UPI0037447D35